MKELAPAPLPIHTAVFKLKKTRNHSTGAASLTNISIALPTTLNTAE